MPTLYLMRGLPGSGKTTRAKEIAEQTGAKIVSADHYFTEDDGTYKFDPVDLQDAHSYCRRMFLGAVVNCESVIVDNTNRSQREMEFYLFVAQEMGYNWHMVYPKTEWQADPWACYERCTHGVPLDTIRHMLNTWEV